MTYNYTLQQEEEYDLAWQEEKDEERETIQVGPIIGGQEGHDTSRWWKSHRSSTVLKARPLGVFTSVKSELFGFGCLQVHLEFLIWY